jgi:hypothetical protein
VSRLTGETTTVRYGAGSRDTDVMELSPFRIERFYAQYEHSTRFMLQQ